VKLSNKGCYGIKAVFDVAYYGNGHSMQIRDISRRQGIPARFLEQIFQDLKRAGIVISKRGPKGGYHLAQAPSEIKLGDILRVLEGHLMLGLDSPASGAEPAGHRVVEEVLSELSSKIEACFDALSVADLCIRTEKLLEQSSRDYMYMI